MICNIRGPLNVYICRTKPFEKSKRYDMIVEVKMIVVGIKNNNNDNKECSNKERTHTHYTHTCNNMNKCMNERHKKAML